MKFKICPVITQHGVEYYIQRKVWFGWRTVSTHTDTGFGVIHNCNLFLTVEGAADFIRAQYGQHSTIVKNCL